MNVVVPQASNYHYGGSQPNQSNLSTYDNRPASPPTAGPNREKIMFEFEEARKTYHGVLERERAELDNAKHLVDALEHEKKRLIKDLADAKANESAAIREKESAHAKFIADSACMRADTTKIKQENETLLDEMKKMHSTYLATLAERGHLEALVGQLRSELVAVGRTVVDQTGTIRSLTSEMSRRDPYHLVKEKREKESQAVSVASLEEANASLQQKLSVAVKEQNAAVEVASALQRDLEAAKQALAKASKAVETTKLDDEANITKLTAQLKDREREKEELLKKAQEANEKLFEAKSATKLAEARSEDLGKQVADLKKIIEANKTAPPPQATPQLPVKSPAPTTTGLDEVERKTYETRVLELMTQVKEEKTKCENMISQFKAALSTLSRLERVAPGPNNFALESAPLVDVTICIESCENLIERDMKNKGMQDPFVAVVDPFGETIYKTRSVDNTNSPKYNPAEDRATIRIARGFTGIVCLQVWTLGSSSQQCFLGCAMLSCASLLQSKGKRVADLTAREKENDEIILSSKGKLGSIVFSVELEATGAKLAKALSTPPQPLVDPTASAAKPVQVPATTQPPAIVAPSASTSSGGQPTGIAPTAPLVVAPQPQRPRPPPPTVPQDVIFYISQCNDLLKRDCVGGSDPMVKVLREGGKKLAFATSVMDGTSDPKWVQSESSCKTFKVAPGDPDPYVFEVWDDDPAGQDFLGRAVITADQVLQGSGPRVLQLVPRVGEADDAILQAKGNLGTLTVVFTLLAEAAKQGQATSERPNQPAGTAPTAPPAPPAVAAPPTKEQVAAVSTGPAQKVLVQVVGCNGLSTRMMSSTDPFVVVRDPTGQIEKKTPIANKNANPTWAPEVSSFDFIIAPSDKSFLVFDVWDDQSPLSSKFLGQAKMSANEVLAVGESRRTMQLLPRENEPDSDVKGSKNLGTITVQFSFLFSALPTGGAAGAPSASSGGAAPAGTKPTTNVTVVEAPPVEDFREAVVAVLGVKGVLARNTFKGSDVYAEVFGIDGKKKCTTPIRENATTATWEKLDGQVKCLLNPNDKNFMLVQFWDSNALSSPNFLGEVKLTVADIFASNGQIKNYPLCARDREADQTIIAAKGVLGTATISLEVNGLATGRVSSMVKSFGTRIQAPSGSAPFPARVWVKGCTGLMNRQPNGEISDPFVIVNTPDGKEHRTKTIDNNLDPCWDVMDGSIKFTVDPTDKNGFITCKVIDVGVSGAAKRMGFMQVAIRDLVSEGFGVRTYKLGTEEKENDPELVANKDKLGHIVVEVLPEEPQAPPAPNNRPAGVSAQPRRFSIQVQSAAKLLKRQKPPAALVEVRDSSGQLIFTTSAAQENINPVWITMPNSMGTTVLTPVDAGELTFTVVDVRPDSRGALGMAKLPVRSIFDPLQPARVFELPIGVSEKENDPTLLSNKANLGSLSIEIKFADDPQAAPSPQPVPAQTPVVAQSNTGTAAPVVATPPAPTKQKVSISIKAGKNLLVMDWKTSDPFVRLLKNGAEFFKSPTINSNVNPTWSNCNAPPVEITKGSSDTITFAMADEDGIGKDDDMGSCVLTADQVLSFVGTEQQLPLKLKDGPAGVLIVSFA